VHEDLLHVGLKGVQCGEVLERDRRGRAIAGDHDEPQPLVGALPPQDESVVAAAERPRLSRLHDGFIGLREEGMYERLFTVVRVNCVRFTRDMRKSR